MSKTFKPEKLHLKDEARLIWQSLLYSADFFHLLFTNIFLIRQYHEHFELFGNLTIIFKIFYGITWKYDLINDSKLKFLLELLGHGDPMTNSLEGNHI